MGTCRRERLGVGKGNIATRTCVGLGNIAAPHRNILVLGGGVDVARVRFGGLLKGESCSNVVLDVCVCVVGILAQAA